MLRRVLLICFFVSLTAAGAWYYWYYLRPQPVAAGAAQADPGAFKYMYCSQCTLEWKCPPGTERHDMPCPRCGMRYKKIMGVYNYSHAFVTIDRPENLWWPTLTLGGTASLGMLWLVLNQRQRARQKKEQERTFYTRCPGCGRRLKYGLSRAGGKGLCPACKEHVEFPDPKKQVMRWTLRRVEPK
jgi:hypothetical protein